MSGMPDHREGCSCQRCAEVRNEDTFIAWMIPIGVIYGLYKLVEWVANSL